MRIIVAFVFAALAVATVSGQTPTRDEAFGPDLHIREFRIPTADTPSLTLFLREKYLANGTNGVGMANKTVLFVAGATYPGSTSFDLELDGLSWMDYIARSGYDVFVFDKRGYGRSSRPQQMMVYPSPNCTTTAPLCDTSLMADDVYTIVQFILGNRNIQQLNILGWSWGTSIMSLFSSRHPELVNKLVLYSPQWVRAPNAAPVACYRTVDRSGALTRWMNQVPVPQNNLIPPPWFDIWWNATVALYNADNVTGTTGLVRAPNGIQVDNSIFWGMNTPVYNITQLTMPVLVIHAQWDVDLPFTTTLGFWYNLTNSSNKRLIELPQGTHTIIMEKNRMQLFRNVQLFLDEPMVPTALVSQDTVDYSDTQIAMLQVALGESQAATTAANAAASAAQAEAAAASANATAATAAAAAANTNAANANAAASAAQAEAAAAQANATAATAAAAAANTNAANANAAASAARAEAAAAQANATAANAAAAAAQADATAANAAASAARAAAAAAEARANDNSNNGGSSSSSSSNKGAIAAAVIFGILTGVLAVAVVVLIRNRTAPMTTNTSAMYTRFDDSTS